MAKVMCEFVANEPIVMACETKDINQVVQMALNAKETNNVFYSNHEKEKREGKDIKSIRIEL